MIAAIMQAHEAITLPISRDELNLEHSTMLSCEDECNKVIHCGKHVFRTNIFRNFILQYLKYTCL